MSVMIAVLVLVPAVIAWGNSVLQTLCLESGCWLADLLNACAGIDTTPHLQCCNQVPAKPHMSITLVEQQQNPLMGQINNEQHRGML